MTVDYTDTLELCLGTVWTDVTPDLLRSNELTMRRGMSGCTPLDRTADVGQMSFALNNSASNSGGTLGWYSPDHADHRVNFDLGTKARWSITYGGITKTKFVGKIVDIAPKWGAYLERQTLVTSADYMDEILNHNVRLLTVQATKRPDQLLGTVIANLPNAPGSATFVTDPDTYTYGLNDLVDEKTSAMTAVQHIGMSGLGYTFMKDNDNLCYESRLTRLVKTSSATFNNTMTGLEAKRSLSEIKNTVKVSIQSPRIDTTVVALYTLRNEIYLPPTKSQTIVMRYTDPLGQTSRVSMLAGSEKTQVSDTDYKMSSISGDGGNDLNGNLGKVITYGGNAASVVLTNNHATKGGYVNKFILSAKGMYLYDPLEFEQTDGTSKTAYGDITLSYNAYYQNSSNFGRALSNELIRRLKDPFTKNDGLTYIANSNAALMAYARDLDIGDKITVAETVTGINKDYFINGIEMTRGAGMLTVKYACEPVWASGLFILDVSRLDGADVLYF